VDIKGKCGDKVQRLAWLPIVFLTEQEDVLEQHSRDEDIEDAYRDVLTTSLWVYSLYTYLGMVRRRFGHIMEIRVRDYQRAIFNDEEAGFGDSIFSALGLVDCALKAGVERDPDWNIQFKLPAELAVALALLLGLPDSPDYRSRKPKPSDYAAHRMPGIDWRLARVLARGKQEILKTFSPVIDKFKLVPEQALG